MDMLHESYPYQEILREGEARGKARGEGIGMILGIEAILKGRFGEDG